MEILTAIIGLISALIQLIVVLYEAKRKSK